MRWRGVSFRSGLRTGSGAETMNGVDLGAPDRHQLHLGGDRDGNSALWRIALVRMHCHQPTRDYVSRRTAEGRTKKEIKRCLMRCVAREAYPLLVADCP